MKTSGSSLLLDTNAISELAAYVVLADRVAQQFDQVYIPLVAYGEYRAGIMGSVQQERTVASFTNLLRIAELLLPDRTTADIYAAIFHELKKKGRPIPTNDIWIAALARQHGIPIMTRDHHFQQIDAIALVGW